MATKFSDFMRGIEESARAEGPEAIAELEAFREHFRVGRQLAQARIALKLSQSEVAKKANVAQADVSRIERGSANPTFNTLAAVACAVDLQIDFKPRKRG